MDSQNLFDIVSVTISTILSVGAIFLSIWFYRESNRQNKDTSLMQADIKNAVVKLEQLYNRIYTDTFGALKTQLDAMQHHIFTSSVGNTNSSEPNNLRLCVIGCITERADLTIEELCNQVAGFKQTEITEVVYTIHREGLVSFDGKRIKYLKVANSNLIEGQGS